MVKYLKSLVKVWRTLSDSNARPSGSKNESAFSDQNKEQRKYLSTLGPSTHSAGSSYRQHSAKYHPVLLSCSVFVPFLSVGYPQPCAFCALAKKTCIICQLEGK